MPCGSNSSEAIFDPVTILPSTSNGIIGSAATDIWPSFHLGLFCRMMRSVTCFPQGITLLFPQITFIELRTSRQKSMYISVGLS